MTQASISFDHAADFYDATRALPAPVQSALTDVLLAELASANAERVLEAGIGTGRIARPLAERGVRVCGVDIAPRMLARLRAQLTPRHVPPDLLLGDATRLPLANGSFGAVIVCHVLHLIPGWEAAIGEMRRVLAPGGVVLHFVNEDAGRDEWEAAQELIDRLLKERDFVRRSRAEDEDIGAAMSAMGGTCRTETVAEEEERYTPARMLDISRRRVNSWTWEIPPDLLGECLDGAERWAREKYGDLNSELVRRVAYRLQVWSFP